AVVVRPAQLAADVAGGRANLRVLAQALDLVGGAIGDDDQALVERGGPHRRGHGTAVGAEGFEADVALVIEGRCHGATVSHRQELGSSSLSTASLWHAGGDHGILRVRIPALLPAALRLRRARRSRVHRAHRSLQGEGNPRARWSWT